MLTVHAILTHAFFNLRSISFTYHIAQLEIVDCYTQDRRLIKVLGILLQRKGLGYVGERVIFFLSPRMGKNARLFLDRPA